MSIYKNFRDYRNVPATPGQISKRFDQPTYMSFRLVFAEYDHLNQNKIGANEYDTMPHPLFGQVGTANTGSRTTYSAIDYLYDANEHTRAIMMQNFINHFNKLQSNYQYYFQSVEGVGDLLKVNPKNGLRVPSDKRLTITMLEGVDLRTTHMLNLYRKIVWDDTYQRWILPDMMRYFTLDIYVTEFRTFHTPNQYNSLGEAVDRSTPTNQTVLKVINDIFPSWVIRCEMCEFDIESFDFDYLPTLSVGADPAEAKVKFGIKVGKIYEEQSYPMFHSAYLIDKKLNSYERSKTSIAGSNEPFDLTSPEFGLETLSLSNLRSGQHTLAVNSERDRDGLHTSGQDFNRPPDSPDGTITKVDYSLRSVADIRFGELDPARENTWVNNAMSYGKAFMENKTKDIASKATITPIPGLGISFNEAVATIQSKDIVTALGTARKAVSSAVNYWTGAEAPSSRLDTQLVDDAFRSFLQGLSQSVATDPGSVALVEAAGVALSNNGIWEKIRDYSLATDFVTQGEEDSGKTIQGGSQFEEMRQALPVTPQPLTRVIIEGIPTSAATTNRIIKG